MWKSALAVVLVCVAWPAQAQTAPPSNQVGECTLIMDPTALRLCVESARQARPAATFDPSAAQPGSGIPNGTDLLPSWPGAAHNPSAGKTGAKPAAGAAKPWMP